MYNCCLLFLGCQNGSRGRLCLHILLEPLLHYYSDNPSAQLFWQESVFLHNAHNQSSCIYALLHQSYCLFFYECTIPEGEFFISIILQLVFSFFCFIINIISLRLGFILLINYIVTVYCPTFTLLVSSDILQKLFYNFSLDLLFSCGL